MECSGELGVGSWRWTVQQLQHTFKTLALNLSLSVSFSSLVIFFVPYGTFLNGAASDGKDLDDYSSLAFTTFTALIVVVTGQIAFDTAYWTAISHVVIWGSLIFYFLLAFLIYEGQTYLCILPQVQISRIM